LRLEEWEDLTNPGNKLEFEIVALSRLTGLQILPNYCERESFTLLNNCKANLTGRERSCYLNGIISVNLMRTMAKATIDEEFLEYVIKALVDHPEDVKIARKVDEMGVLLSLKVNPEDMGQIIGKAGSTARAIRSLVRIVGLKNHARVNLKIEEPEGALPRERRAPTEGGDLEELKL